MFESRERLKSNFLEVPFTAPNNPLKPLPGSSNVYLVVDSYTLILNIFVICFFSYALPWQCSPLHFVFACCPRSYIFIKDGFLSPPILLLMGAARVFSEGFSRGFSGPSTQPLAVPTVHTYKYQRSVARS